MTSAAQLFLAAALVTRPDALIDLTTEEGARLVKGQWRYSDTRIVEIESPGPKGEMLRAYNLMPQAGAADFDDSAWPAIAPASLRDRRTNGRVAFNWYRIHLTVPDRIGRFDTAGSTVAFECVVDDYAEIWVNGRLMPALGQSGGAVAAGFNAPNRVLLTHNARPGQQFQVAVFGINAPISAGPRNFIWMRSATLDFYKEGRLAFPEAKLEVVRLDPALDAIIPARPRLERLAAGFSFIEGPVWTRDGALLFSDPNDNTIYRWSAEGGVAVFRPKSGYTGADIGEYGQPGSNGLTLDRQGRLTINEHGNRRVTRLEPNGNITVLASHYQGKRLNSPNDLVYRSDGALYFTDPPFGLPKFHDDPRRELPFTGVFRLSPEGELTLLSTDLKGPNGIAFSPDEKYLYVANWDERKKVVMRYEVRPDGGAGPGSVFFDMTAAQGEEALDGLKVDRAGNLYVSGPGGVWILSPEGKHLGTLRFPELPANFAWGGEDGKTLYLTARTSLYRLRLNIPGVRP